MYMPKFLCAAFGLAVATNSFAITKKTFDFVVGVDGNFKQAIAAAPGTSSGGHFLIFVPNGEYNIGSLTGDSNQKTAFEKSNISLIGESSDKTILYNKSINEGISVTATLYLHGNDIYLQDMTILNKANYGDENNCGSACRHVAVQQQGDKIIYKQVKLLSTQDTYYTKKGRTYWDGGQIEGTVDFICGDGDAYFNGTNLVMRRSGGYITAAQTSSDWGYVFNNAKINVSSGSFNGNFYLGRSWGRAKTVFLNTTMYAQPKAEGWYQPINYVPQVFAEYNSKDGNGNAINLSYRQRNYTDKNGGSATLNPVLSASEAAKYTVNAVMAGWAPDVLTKQVAAPTLVQNGATLQWEDNEDALNWVIFVNGKYKANVVTNSYDISGLKIGDIVTIRTANSMGGLGEASKALTISDMSANSFAIAIEPSVGGSIAQTPIGSRLAEGSSVTFTAIPAIGWKFDSWAADATGNGDSWKVASLEKDIKVEAHFLPVDMYNYEAEAGDVENGWKESSNAGFSGEGYVNFNAGISYVKVPVFARGAGKFELSMVYTNGSTAARKLSVCTEDCDKPEVLEFGNTANWTTWETKTTSVTLPQGISYITFATVDGNDGPNLDKISLEEIDIETAPDSSKPEPSFVKKLAFEKSFTYQGHKILFENATGSFRAVLYGATGQKIAETTSRSMDVSGLQKGVYMLKVYGKTAFSKLIQIR